MKRRWLVKIAVLLVLGAIVNVAVAWGCALLVDVHAENGRAFVAGGEHRRWSAPGVAKMYSRWWSRVVLLHLARQDSTAQDVWNWPDSEETLGMAAARPFYRVRLADSYGLPMLSLGCEQIGVRWLDHGQSEYRSRGGYDLGIPGMNVAGIAFKQLIPLEPLWPGFTVNTAFYAAILWLLFAASERIRGWWRIRRGLCPACAYPVGSAEVCTECGKRAKGAP